MALVRRTLARLRHRMTDEQVALRLGLCPTCHNPKENLA